ncbi:hypothetical protein VEL36_003898 [Cronobacter sakazakii]|nr:hypothetical protein [Cronobacter sakazakii]
MDMKKTLRLLKNLLKSTKYNKLAASRVRALKQTNHLSARTREAAQLIRSDRESQYLQWVIEVYPLLFYLSPNPLIYNNIFIPPKKCKKRDSSQITAQKNWL